MTESHLGSHCKHLHPGQAGRLRTLTPSVGKYPIVEQTLDVS